MLKHQLTHPKINEVLGRAGHYSKVLIADGNYPAYNTMGPNAELVSLNLSPGVVTCTQVLEALLSAVHIDAANTMMYQVEGPYALEQDPPIWDEYRQLFSASDSKVELEPIEQMTFYETVRSPEHVLTIHTADQSLYANLLLTIGVRR
ncbi:MAG: transporter [Blastopirellula sp.]|nr:MAG: transporter [Blastopirellula sp.]